MRLAYQRQLRDVEAYWRRSLFLGIDDSNEVRALIVEYGGHVVRADRAHAADVRHCGRPWLDESERWRSRLDDDDLARLFCPGCDEQEFGES